MGVQREKYEINIVFFEQTEKMIECRFEIGRDYGLEEIEKRVKKRAREQRWHNRSQSDDKEESRC